MLIVSGMTAESGHERSGHPERPARIRSAMAAVGDLHLGNDLTLVPAYAADRPQLTRVHAANYLDELAAFCRAGGGDIDPDTYATGDS